jgi:hypothetical protein
MKPQFEALAWRGHTSLLHWVEKSLRGTDQEFAENPGLSRPYRPRQPPDTLHLRELCASIHLPRGRRRLLETPFV